MTDPLPADVRDILERARNADPSGIGASVLRSDAARVLACYPKPAPAWQPGDAVLYKGEVFTRHKTPTWSCANNVSYDSDIMDADLIAHGGRRVHPARFHDHAKWLRAIATDIEALDQLVAAEHLRTIADDIDPEVQP